MKMDKELCSEANDEYQGGGNGASSPHWWSFGWFDGD
jgi:hypothetical protein